MKISKNMCLRDNIEISLNKIDFSNKILAKIELRNIISSLKNEIQILDLNKKYNCYINNNKGILKMKNNNEVLLDRIIKNKQDLQWFFNYLLRKKDNLESKMLKMDHEFNIINPAKIKKSKAINILQNEILLISKDKSFKINFDFINNTDNKKNIDDLFLETRLSTL